MRPLLSAPAAAETARKRRLDDVSRLVFRIAIRVARCNRRYCRVIDAEVAMARSGKFVIKHGRGGKSEFVLLASNGRVVATSETYESKESCLKGIDAIKRLAADATVIEEPATTARAINARKAKAARK
jgi:uncharacterized protein YegP (UPF0339 family)